MNVLIISRWIYPEVYGGAYKYLFDLARNLASKGHNVHLLYCTTNKSKPMPARVDNIWHHCYFIRRISPLLDNLRYIKHTLKMATELHNSIQFDIINVHDVRVPLGVFFSKALRDVPIVLNFQASSAYEFLWDAKKAWSIPGSWLTKLGMLIRFPFHYLWHHWCNKIALKHSSGIIVLSEYVSNYLQEFYGQRYKGKIVKIPAGVDTNLFKPALDKSAIRKKLNLPAEQIIFLTVRRLAYRMGLFNLLDAFKILTEKKKKLIDSVFLIIVGGGVLQAELEKRISQLNLTEMVRLTGRVSEEQLLLYYQSVDCFVLPTEELEGFGIVTIEALACGLPVLATPKGASPEILREINPQFIAKSHRPIDIAHTLSYFIDNFNQLKSASPDNPYRQVAVQKYGWGKVIEQIEHYLSRLRKQSDA